MSALDVVEAQTESGIPAGADRAEPAGTYRKRKLGVLVLGLGRVAGVPARCSARVRRPAAAQGPERDVPRRGPPGPRQRALVRRRQHRPRRVRPDDLRRPALARRGRRRHARRHRCSGASVGLIVGLLPQGHRRHDHRRSSTSCWPSPASCCCSRSISFLAPPGEASPSTQTFWVTVALSILVIPAIARITAGPDDGVGRPRLRHGVADARGPQQADHRPRDPAQRRADARARSPSRSSPCLIIVEAALAFFGVGDVSGVSWGLMIQNGRSQLERTPHMVLFPATVHVPHDPLPELRRRRAAHALRRAGRRHLMAGSGTAHLRDGHRRQGAPGRAHGRRVPDRAAARSTPSATSASTSSTARRSASSASPAAASRRPARRSCASRRRRRAACCSTASTCRTLGHG